ncbi:PadR family transcriptional regulator [Pseudonocardia acaciae]|uniref:PadR family transcriptional regulator n=1 Tax=Pseudonocardia acaciae TaxID=551276 RepID=UPI00048F84FD|nr:PadR family transcriptional regulator [Pseudonocardia acaciae]
MSLRHALLAVLTAEPMTGYDLVKQFDGSVAYVWSAPNSQIYPELRRMERDGLLDVRVLPRGDRAEKRMYAINDAGLAELHRWLRDPTTYAAERDPYRLRAAHFEFSTYEDARQQLTAHVRHFTNALNNWEQLLSDVRNRRVPLLRRRLEERPEAEHEAIVAFRLFAFQGEVDKAKFEIAWAERGLTMIDDLERRNVPLWGAGEAGQAG